LGIDSSGFRLAGMGLEIVIGKLDGNSFLELIDVLDQ